MLVRISWLAIALIHLLPALALARPALLTRLYGVAPGDPTYLLLWHRAALFAVILALCIWAVFRVEVRPAASVAAAISMIAFLILYAASGMPQSLRTIAVADLIGLPFLAIVTWNAFRAA